MLELAGDLRLLDEPADQLGVVAVPLQQDLDGQVAAEVGVAPLEHGAHPAPGDLAEELEPPGAVGGPGHLGRGGPDEGAGPAERRCRGAGRAGSGRPARSGSPGPPGPRRVPGAGRVRVGPAPPPLGPARPGRGGGVGGPGQSEKALGAEPLRRVRRTVPRRNAGRGRRSASAGLRSRHRSNRSDRMIVSPWRASRYRPPAGSGRRPRRRRADRARRAAPEATSTRLLGSGTAAASIRAGDHRISQGVRVDVIVHGRGERISVIGDMAGERRQHVHIGAPEGRRLLGDQAVEPRERLRRERAETDRRGSRRPRRTFPPGAGWRSAGASGPRSARSCSWPGSSRGVCWKRANCWAKGRFEKAGTNSPAAARSLLPRDERRRCSTVRPAACSVAMSRGTVAF